MRRSDLIIAALPVCLERSFEVALRMAEKDELEHIGTTMRRAGAWAVFAADAVIDELEKEKRTTA